MNPSEFLTDDGQALEFTRFRPDRVPHPGEYLRNELEDLNLSQADFAARTGLSTKHVNQVLKGAASMSPDVAIHLERVLGSDASLWNNFEARWQEQRSRDRERENFDRHVDWVTQFPLRELVARGYLDAASPTVDTVDNVLRLFRVADPDSLERVWLAPVASGFRRAQQYETDDYATASWLLIAERQTASLDLPPFSVTRLRQLLSALRTLTRMSVAEGFLQARRMLASCGVALTFVEAFPRSRVGGAAWWPALNRPIIVLSERHKKADILWFSLFHEIGHLLLHRRRQACVQLAERGDNHDGAETEADQFAADTLIPAEYNPLISVASRVDLIALADKLDIGPAIVAGRKGRLTGKWSAVSALRETLDCADMVNASNHPLD